MSSTLPWYCLCFNFPHFVILENLSSLGLTLSEMNGLIRYFIGTGSYCYYNYYYLSLSLFLLLFLCISK